MGELGELGEVVGLEKIGEGGGEDGGDCVEFVAVVVCVEGACSSVGPASMIGKAEEKCHEQA